MSCSAMKGGFIPDDDLPDGGRKITRRAFTRKSGVHVRARRIQDRGAPGKWASLHGPGIGKLKEGKLTSVGYSVEKGKTARHRALKKAVRSYGPLSTFRKLQAVSTYTKRTSPAKSKTYKADRNWIQKMFM